MILYIILLNSIYSIFISSKIVSRRYSYCILYNIFSNVTTNRKSANFEATYCEWHKHLLIQNESLAGWLTHWRTMRHFPMSHPTAFVLESKLLFSNHHINGQNWSFSNRFQDGATVKDGDCFSQLYLVYILSLSV